MISKCIICGKEFIKLSNRQMYCGEGCRRKSQKENTRKSSLNYLHKHKNLKKYKDIALRNYGYKCAVCGWCYQEPVRARISEHVLTKNGCDVHHVIPVSKGGSDELNNLIVLCPNCHKIVHLMGKKSIEQLKGFQYTKTKEELEKQDFEMVCRFSENIENVLQAKENI